MNTYPTARPGRHTVQAPVVHAPNAALLIDFDNVTLGIRSDLTKELKTLLGSEIIRGKVAVQRAYADWRRYPQYIVPLTESSIDLIFAPATGTSKKNATDIRLAVDAMELVFTRPEVGTFMLLSGDSDFSSLVLKLKEYGKYVIGVGIRESASDLLIQNCDEYYSYSDLAGLTREADVPSTQRDPWELVVEAAQQMARNGDVMRSDRLKQVMQQIDPNFVEKNAGFNRFSKFVTAAGDKGLIKVTKLDNGQYEIAAAGRADRADKAGTAGRAGRAGGTGKAGGAPAAPVPAVEPVEEGARRSRGRRRGRGRGRGAEEREETTLEVQAPAPEPRQEGALTLAEAFQMLQRALGELRPPVGHDKLRARMVALLGREDALLSDDRFPRLLRQANDAEIADVRKLAEDRFEVSPHRTQALAHAAARSAAETSLIADADAAAPEAVPAAEPEVDSSRRSATLRFRRGSRGPLRSSEVLLVGAVKMAPEAKPVADAAPVKGKRGGKAEKSEKSEKAAKPVKAAKAPKGKKPKAEAAASDPPSPAPASGPPAEATAAKQPNGRRRRGGRGRSKPKA